MSKTGLQKLKACFEAEENHDNGFASMLENRFPGFRPGPAFQEVSRRYPAQAPDELLELVKEPDYKDPVYRQIAPSEEELTEGGDEDPAGETEFAAVPGLLHRYPDRALIITTNNCLVRCRHCMRKRLWSNDREDMTSALSEWCDYLSCHPEIKEVILSGGDPLALPDARLLPIIEKLGRLPGKRLRVHSRALMASPKRITDGLARAMAECGVKRFVTQMNHPVELTEKTRQAARRLEKAGVKVENQAVLLKGVNDSAETLAELFSKTASAGIRPYYLHHPDRATGCLHFYLELEQGAEIFQKAKQLYTGQAPAYVIDQPGSNAKQDVLSLLR